MGGYQKSYLLISLPFFAVLISESNLVDFLMESSDNRNMNIKKDEDEMWLELDASEIEIKLQINGYVPSTKDNWDSQWCRCDYLFSSGDWLNYHKEDDEVLLSCEVEELEECLTKLIDNEMSEIKEIACIEPDFVFVLHPQSDRREDPKYTYVQPGYEIEDIYLEWKIFFWNGGLTDNHLVVMLGRDEIISVRDYLLAVTKKKT